MSHITTICASASHSCLLQQVLLNLTDSEYNLEDFIGLVKIKKIEHEGTKNGHHYVLGVSTGHANNISSLIETLKQDIRLNFFQWVNVSIIEEGRLLYKWSDEYY